MVIIKNSGGYIFLKFNFCPDPKLSVAVAFGGCFLYGEEGLEFAGGFNYLETQEPGEVRGLKAYQLFVHNTSMHS